jgi:hypothetical protein
LNEQEAKAIQENTEVIEPLRALRERNHFAEMIMANIADGYNKER